MISPMYNIHTQNEKKDKLLSVFLFSVSGAMNLFYMNVLSTPLSLFLRLSSPHDNVFPPKDPQLVCMMVAVRVYIYI